MVLSGRPPLTCVSDWASGGAEQVHRLGPIVRFGCQIHCRRQAEVDALLENCRRLEHHDASRRNWDLPSLGLRPIRWPFLRTTNDANEESFTVSPRSMQSVIYTYWI
jgi:hypothetical protein